MLPQARIASLAALFAAALSAAAVPAAAFVYVSGTVRIKGAGAPTAVAAPTLSAARTSGAVIAVYRPAAQDPILTTQTLPNGAYVLRLPAAGAYRIVIQQPNCLPFEKAFTVPPSGLLKLDLFIDPIPSILGLFHADTPEGRRFRAELAHAAADLAAARKAVGPQEADAPASTASLARFLLPVPPAAENAATDYQELDKLLHQKPISSEDDALVNEAASGNLPAAPVDRALHEKKLQQFLSSRRDIMDLVRRAAEKPYCNFQRDWRLGPQVTTPEYLPMRQADRLLTAEAYLLLSAGHPLDAIKNEALSYHIMGHLASDPDLIAYLVARVCDTITTNSLAQIVDAGWTNSDVLDGVRQTLLADRPGLDMRRSITFEYAMMLPILHTLRQGSPKEWREFMGSGQNLTLDPPGETTARFTAEDQKSMSSVVDALEVRALENIHSFIQAPAVRVPVRPADLHSDDADNDPISQIFAISSPLLMSRDSQAQARANAVLTGIAVLQYQHKTGHLPQRLSDAMPQPPIDPFSGTPLQYKIEPHGFVIYSVGATGHFDGGNPHMDRDPQNDYFRYPS